MVATSIHVNIDEYRYSAQRGTGLVVCPKEFERSGHLWRGARQCQFRGTKLTGHNFRSCGKVPATDSGAADASAGSEHEKEEKISATVGSPAGGHQPCTAGATFVFEMGVNEKLWQKI